MEGRDGWWVSLCRAFPWERRVWVLTSSPPHGANLPVVADGLNLCSWKAYSPWGRRPRQRQLKYNGQGIQRKAISSKTLGELLLHPGGSLMPLACPLPQLSKMQEHQYPRVPWSLGRGQRQLEGPRADQRG